MRRGAAAAVIALACLCATGAIAMAATQIGTDGGRVVADGRSGNDRIRTGSFSDSVAGGPGADSVDSGAGDDILKTRDRHRDRVQCGPGSDTVCADPSDLLSGCEDVHTRPARIG